MRWCCWLIWLLICGGWLIHVDPMIFSFDCGRLSSQQPNQILSWVDTVCDKSEYATTLHCTISARCCRNNFKFFNKYLETFLFDVVQLFLLNGEWTESHSFFSTTMLDLKTRWKIVNMHLEEGTSRHAIAKKLKINIHTVRQWIRIPPYSPVPNNDLDPIQTST